VSYVVTNINLAPIPNVHGGTGTHVATIWVVDPASVPGSSSLAFSGLDVEVTTMLFAIADAVVPNWFGVALPRGISDFTRPHLFFHPTPAQAGYVDGDYQSKGGKWPELFYYMERLGYQLDGARRNQVLVMPFMTEARKDAGILVTDWQDILTQILTQVRTIYDPSDNSPLTIFQLVVSSFSAGMIYSHNFRSNGAAVADVLAEVWDFDGRFSTYSWLSAALHSTSQPHPVQAIKYDQLQSADASAYHVPLSRWQTLVDPPTSNMDVHALIRDFMFLDGATVSGVGSLLSGSASGPTTITAGTHTAGTNTLASIATATGTPVLLGGSGDVATGAITASIGTHSISALTVTGTHTGTQAQPTTATHAFTATHAGTQAPPTTATQAVTATTEAHTGTQGLPTTATTTVSSTMTASHTAPAPQHPRPPAPALPPPTPRPPRPPAPLAPLQPPPPEPPAVPAPSQPAARPPWPQASPQPQAPPGAGHQPGCVVAVTAIAGQTATVAQLAITSIAALRGGVRSAKVGTGPVRGTRSNP
jgi:hypothetical protein